MSILAGYDRVESPKSVWGQRQSLESSYPVASLGGLKSAF